MRNQPSTCLNYIHLLDSESTQVSLCYPVLNKKSFHGTCSDLPSCSKSLPTCIQRRYVPVFDGPWTVYGNQSRTVGLNFNNFTMVF